MSKSLRTILFVGLFVSAGWGASTWSPAAAAPLHNVIVVIAAKDLGAHDVSIGLLRRLFGGDTTEAGGKRLTPFNFVPDDPIRRGFDSLILQMDPSSVSTYWIDRRIRGQGLPPRTVPTPQLMKAVVAKLPGAIGYIALDQLDDGVQALLVDGKGPNDPHYPLIVR